MLLADYFRSKALKHRAINATLEQLRDRVEKVGASGLTLTELLQVNEMMSQHNALTKAALTSYELAEKVQKFKASKESESTGQYL